LKTGWWWRVLIAALLAAPVVLPACGSDDDAASSDGARERSDQESAPPEAVHVATVDNAFDPKTLAMSSGDPVSVHVENRGSSRHTFTVPTLNVSVTVDSGAAKIVKLDIPTRETEFLCEFHGSGGMTGLIIPQ
jgi:plastocyanin